MTNRLIHEKSPYLLQHAHNPVDWFAWGQEAFDEAARQNKPIFLSIGYATCHWCHVMEKESFENPEMAQLLNETFVNIKVDREELPEVDSLYMEFAQAIMSSAGGWPLNVLLTPDLKPFFAVTYLPPRSSRGMMGLDEFIAHIHKAWQGEERTRLLEQADKVVAMFAQQEEEAVPKELPSQHLLIQGEEALFEVADTVYGGIKGEPKFPLGYSCDFLLEFARSRSDSRALFFVDLTLTKMGKGGLYDQLGGGFSRYSVDEKWQVPHFEKMLYDNALLARAYLNAWRFTKNPFYRRICTETLDYVLRDMRSAEGGFYSAEDADSEGKEGLFYTWMPVEVGEVLSKEAAEKFCAYYGVTPEGNFEGRSVLHVAAEEGEFSDEAAKKALFEKRQKRPRPFKDDKILTSWNGLMIDALAEAGGALGEKRYLDAALQAAQFIKNSLWKEGRLLRRFRQGSAGITGGLEDYAFLIKGVLTLYKAGLGVEWLEWATQMAAILDRDFTARSGAFYPTDEKQALLVRKVSFYDGAEPSGNGVHTENLLRLYQLTGNNAYLRRAEEALKAAKVFMETYPPGACYHLLALQRYLDVKAPLIVVALDEEQTLKTEISSAFYPRFVPHAEIVWKTTRESATDKGPIDGQTAVYICRQTGCEAPLIAKEEILKALEETL